MLYYNFNITHSDHNYTLVLGPSFLGFYSLYAFFVDCDDYSVI